MSTELFKTIARVRRSMPRNADVMQICDALEAELTMITQEELNTASDVMKKHKAQFDKTAYMRDYMRKKRAAERSE